MSSVEHVKEFYGEHWAEYPLDLQKVFPHLERLFPEGVEGKRVLDAGSGSGMVSIAFAKMGAQVTAVDISPGCIENGRRRAKEMGVDIRFIQADLTQLDLGEQFDIIYSWGVLHHTPDAERAFYRLVDHLAPGGVIVIAVYLKTWLSGFWNFSRVFYRNSPPFVRAAIRGMGTALVKAVDAIRGKPIETRGSSIPELVNDWFGVPHRTFHTYEEVFGWFEKRGLSYELTDSATGRFRSTSNFEVKGRKPPE